MDDQNFVAPEGSGFVVYVNGERRGWYQSQADAENAFNNFMWPGGGGGGGGGGAGGGGAAGGRGYQPGTDLYQMLSQLYGPAIEERRQRELERQFNERLAFERAMNEFRQQQERAAAARAEAQITGYFGGAPTLQRQQYASQLAANPRDYAAYFNFTRPGQPIPVPAFAAQLASGQSLGRPSGVPFRVGAVQGGGGIQGGWQETPGPVTPGGGIQGGWQETPGPVTPGGGIQGGWQETPGQMAASFGLAPGQFTPRNLRMMTPSERATSESLISAQGEDPADFYARAQQFFPMGRVSASARYTSY